MHPLFSVAPPTAEIAGGAQRFPIRRIFCVGKNYADHAREMGGDPTREPPFFFSKPADAVASGTADIAMPSRTANLHHEIELVIALGQGGTDIAPEDALAAVFGYAVGNDLTRRDLQADAKAGGRPWDMAKGFDRSAPIGALTRGAPPETGAIGLTIDGEPRQSGDLSMMIWSVAEVIAALSRQVELAPGDLIFTGTPAGVGPILPGAQVRATITDLEPLEILFDA